MNKVKKHTLSRYMRFSVTIAAGMLAAAIPFQSRAVAQTAPATETILHSFGDGSVLNDGLMDPGYGDVMNNAALIQGSDGNFYGTTASGGSTVDGSTFSGWGTAYTITPSGKMTILHSFGDGSVPNDGETPLASLIQGPDGNFYGTTQLGGTASMGTIFKMTPAGQVTVLHNFGDGSVSRDGLNPTDALILATDGNFYGTTSSGGTLLPGGGYAGVVFKMTPTGHVSILHDFGDGSVIDDGLYPSGLIQAADGNFYGTTENGGGTKSDVTVFGPGYGTAFMMTPAGKETILHSFGDGSVPKDGILPGTGFIEAADGNFYGTTWTGGSTVGNTVYSYGFGVAFKMTRSGDVTILHDFGDGSVPNDGLFPSALIQGIDGKFYGTANEGGAVPAVAGSVPGSFNEGAGTAYSMTSTGDVTELHLFGDGSVANDGLMPVAPLMQSKDGKMYGTTSKGGSTLGLSPIWPGMGTVYTLKLSILSAPTNLTAAAGSGQLALSWTTSTGATSYSVYRGTTAGGEFSVATATGITTTTFTNTGLTNGTTYYYKVAAVNAGGTSQLSIEISATPAAPPAPHAPTGLTASAGSAQIALSWTVSSGATSYNLYRGTASRGEGRAPIVTGIVATSFTDTGLTNGTPYYYYLTAVNASGTSTASGETHATAIGAVVPSAPAGLTATAGNARIALSWTASSGATSYNIYRGTSAGGEAATAVATGVSATTFTNAGLANGTTYYYEVAAVSAGGTSPQSNEASATPTATAPPVPTGLAATASSGHVVLSWTANAGSVSYDIYRGIASRTESRTPYAIGVSSTSYTDTKVTNGDTYYYTVAAVNAAGTSPASVETHATP